MANKKKPEWIKRKMRAVSLSDVEVAEIKRIAKTASLTNAIRELVKMVQDL